MYTIKIIKKDGEVVEKKDKVGLRFLWTKLYALLMNKFKEDDILSIHVEKIKEKQ